MKRSRLLVAAASLAAVPARAFAQTPPLANVEVVVNAPGAGNWLVYCAQHGNFFRDEGLQVGISNSGSPTTTINVVATNSANIGFDGTDVAVEAIAHQLPLKIVAPEFIPTPYALLTTPGIASWNDLKGKTVILGASGGISSITFDLMSAAHGLARTDFTLVRGQTSSSRYQALLSGNVAATVLSQPFSIQAQDAGMRTLAMASETIKDWIDTCIVVNTTWAAASRRSSCASCGRSVRRRSMPMPIPMRRSVHWLRRPGLGRGRAQGLRARLPALAGVRSEAAREPRDLRAMISFAVKEGAIAQTPALGDVYDPSYAAEAAR